MDTQTDPSTDLPTRLHADMKAALKAGHKDRLQVIRMLLSDVQTVDLMPGKPTPLQAVEAYAKKLRKSREEYAKLGRGAEVAQLLAELTVVEEYLPKRASAAQTDAMVAEFLAGKTFTDKQVGPATGAFMKAHGDAVDPGLASAAIRRRLAGG